MIDNNLNLKFIIGNFKNLIVDLFYSATILSKVSMLK